jgi:hypothetical protein
MKVSLFKHINNKWEEYPARTLCNCNAVDLVLCFGDKKLLAESDICNTIGFKFSNAQIAMCSTAGEIFHTSVLDDTITVVAFEFNTTSI